MNGEISIKINKRININTVVMKYLIVLFTVLLISTHNIYAQRIIEGHVVDKETGEPLAYVNIGVVELGIGTVSDKYGNFSLQVLESKADSIMFSAIGYNLKKYAVEEVLSNPKVILSPRTYELETFDVIEKARGRDRIFGRKRGLPYGDINLGGNSPGDEIGAHIRIKKSTYLKSANFYITKVSGDSMIYRVNIYEFKNGKIEDNLLKENVLLEGGQEEGIVTVDLTPYKLVIDQDVLLTLENIKVDLNLYDRGMLFKYISVWIIDKAFYGRRGENSKNVNGEFLKLLEGADPCFFFVGRKLE